MTKPRWETHVNTIITKERIEEAENCLYENGIDPEETDTVLQALGYILLDTELYRTEED